MTDGDRGLELGAIVDRTSPPVPWAEGDNIPWDEPGFSERMLAEHLDQGHDLASRRSARIDAHAAWLHHGVLDQKPSSVLDLACGPGLYTQRLAALGHRCVGIDFAPASIRHARESAAIAGLDVRYELADLRTADFGGGFDLVLLLYGQLNVFRRDEVTSITRRAFDALAPGGAFVIEPQTAAHVEATGHAAPSWHAARSGLFSDRPHLLLTESAWDPDTRTNTERFWCIDAATGRVERHAMSTASWAERELVDLLGSAGFVEVEVLDGLGDDPHPDLTAMIGRVPPDTVSDAMAPDA